MKRIHSRRSQIVFVIGTVLAAIVLSILGSYSNRFAGDVPEFTASELIGPMMQIFALVAFPIAFLSGRRFSPKTGFST